MVSPSLDAFLDQWLESAAKPKLAEPTYLGYKQVLQVHIRPALGSRKLASLQPLDIQKVYQEIHASLIILKPFCAVSGLLKLFLLYLSVVALLSLRGPNAGVL